MTVGAQLGGSGATLLDALHGSGDAAWAVALLGGGNTSFLTSPLGGGAAVLLVALHGGGATTGLRIFCFSFLKLKKKDLCHPDPSGTLSGGVAALLAVFNVFYSYFVPN
jgi:hypothetical protein